jgi:hypothetical protein
VAGAKLASRSVPSLVYLTGPSSRRACFFSKNSVNSLKRPNFAQGSHSIGNKNLLIVAGLLAEFATLKVESKERLDQPRSFALALHNPFVIRYLPASPFDCYMEPDYPS